MAIALKKDSLIIVGAKSDRTTKSGSSRELRINQGCFALYYCVSLGEVSRRQTSGARVLRVPRGFRSLRGLLEALSRRKVIIETNCSPSDHFQTTALGRVAARASRWRLCVC